MSITVDDEFLETHIKLVKSIVNKLTARVPKWIDKGDIFQAGLLGLFCAVERFDSSRQVRFSVFAFHKIRGYVLDSMESQRVVRVPRAVRNKKIKPKKVVELFDNLKDQKVNQELSGVEIEEQKKLIRLAVDELSLREKEIIVLYYYKGNRLREVAEILDLTEGRVSQIKSLAMKKLFNSKYLKLYKK